MWWWNVSALEFLLLGLATYYVALALTRSDGPFGCFRWLRSALPHGGLLECLVCLSLWVGVGFYLLWQIAPAVVQGVAVAGAAVVIDRLTD